ncbi:MAG: hypothetical protein ACXWLH_06365 [Candidatus Saccharimonadales bacterium]
MNEFIDGLTDDGAEILGQQLLESIYRGKSLGAALLEVFEMPLPGNMTMAEWEAESLRTAISLIIK